MGDAIDYDDKLCHFSCIIRSMMEESICHVKLDWMRKMVSYFRPGPKAKERKEKQEFRNKIKSLETQFVIRRIERMRKRIHRQMEQIQALDQVPNSQDRITDLS